MLGYILINHPIITLFLKSIKNKNARSIRDNSISRESMPCPTENPSEKTICNEYFRITE